jgi:hypothetical protein
VPDTIEILKQRISNQIQASDERCIACQETQIPHAKFSVLPWRPSPDWPSTTRAVGDAALRSSFASSACNPFRDRGAGAAGLMTAFELGRAARGNCLEVRDRCGSRIYRGPPRGSQSGKSLV